MTGRGITGWSKGVAVLGAAYLGAAVAAVVAFALWPEGLLWQRLLLADVAATLVVWAVAVALDNTSVYDPYWSVAPLPLAVGAWWMQGGTPLRWVLIFICLGLWGARLTWNFLRGWSGLHHEDWRYVAYRRFGSGPYWLLSLTGLQLMPTLLVFGAMTPVVAAAGATAPVGLLDLAATALALGALAVETLADEQLRAYRHSEPEPDAFLATGLWAWSRHPNYLGEVGFWWGVALFGVAVGAPVTLLGALCITLLFWFISIPLIDARMCARRPAYQAHQARVPRLFPLLPW